MKSILGITIKYGFKLLPKSIQAKIFQKSMQKNAAKTAASLKGLNFKDILHDPSRVSVVKISDMKPGESIFAK